MLLKKGEQIIRVLKEQGEERLVIDCTRKSMPEWVSEEDLSGYEPCSEELLGSMVRFEELSPQQQRCAHERFTLIAGVLPFLGGKKLRNEVIARMAEECGISKQTIRHYLHRYLVYQSMAALAPPPKKQKAELTADEKNMRWALNKFYYTRHKNSLPQAYAQVLRHKYCDKEGKLLADYPPLHQFRYFYRKNRSMQTCYISRDGLKNYQRNNRPLLGDGVQSFAPTVGIGMLDATIYDIHLVDKAGSLVGRLILTTCVDAYSGLCCGYALS